MRQKKFDMAGVNQVGVHVERLTTIEHCLC